MGIGFTKCKPCKGTLIYEKIYPETERFGVWKCACCGECIVAQELNILKK